MGCRTAKLLHATYDNTPLPQYTFSKAKVVKVYDGDTFWIVAWDRGQLCKYSARLYGVNCSEMRGGTEETKNEARAAKQYVAKQIEGKIVEIKVLSNTTVGNRIIKEKYGRLLVSVTVDGVDLAASLISQNLGKPYTGGTKN